MTWLVRTLLERGSAQPNRPAVAVNDTVLTWQDLADQVRGAAEHLSSLGVGQGDRVVLSATTSPTFIVSYFATHLIGGVAVPVDPRIPASRLEFVANAVKPAAIFTTRSAALSDHACRDFEELGQASMALAGSSFGQDLAANANDEATADILFTSGTTGQPKGVVLSHRAIVAAAQQINTFIGNAAEDREVVPLPLSHSFGLGRMRCQVLAGGMMVLVDGFAAAGSLFEAMRRFKATGLSFVPAALGVLFQTTGDTLGDFASTLRWIEIGSAAMSPEDKSRLMALLPRTRLCMHYGLTEASRSAFIELHEASAAGRLESVGRPAPGVELRVADKSGTSVPQGERGRILVKANTLMSRYWRDDHGTIAAFQDGWLISGDIGHFDESGWLYLDAREKDLVNVGGREVSPKEIELILEELDNVAACACVGVPDPQGITGSAIKAFLVPGQQDAPPPRPVTLAKHLRGRIEPYKMPVAFEWIDELPRTPSGKLHRAALAARG